MRQQRRIEALANWYSFRVAPAVSAQARRRGLLARSPRPDRRRPRIVLAPLPDETAPPARRGVPQAPAGSRPRALRRQPRARSRRTELCRIPRRPARPAAHHAEAQGRQGRGDDLTHPLRRRALGDYEASTRESWKPEEGSPAFLRRFRRGGRRGRPTALGHGPRRGQPVAAQFWTVEGGTAFIHKLAHREEAKPLSPAPRSAPRCSNR
jgi:hypothetical protein